MVVPAEEVARGIEINDPLAGQFSLSTISPRTRGLSLTDVGFLAVVIAGNFVLFELLAAILPPYSNSAEVTRLYLHGLGLVLGLLVLGASWDTFIKPAAKSLGKMEITPASLGLVALVFYIMGTVSFALVAWSTFAKSSLLESLPVFVALLIAQEHLALKIRERLDFGTGFRLKRLCPRVKVLSSGPQSEPSVTSAKLIDLTIQSIVLVEEGDFLPVDGVVLSGTALIEERRLSALPTVMVKGAGASVYAGSQVLRGAAVVKVLALPHESFITTFAERLEKQTANPPELENRISEREAWLGVVALLVSFGGGYLWWRHTGQIYSVFFGISSFLVIGLLIGAYRFKVGWMGFSLTRFFERGALLSSADDIGILAKVKCVALLVNREGDLKRPTCLGFSLVDERIDRKGLLEATLAIVSQVDTPSCRAIVDYITGEVSQASLHELRDFSLFEGGGIGAQIGGSEISIGDEDFLLARGVQLQPSDLELVGTGDQAVFVAIGDEPVGAFALQLDALSEASFFVRELKQIGLRPLLLAPSGVASQSLDGIGKTLGLELVDVQRELTENDLIRKLEATFPSVLVTYGQVSEPVKKAASYIIRFFDELRWNDPIDGLTLFDDRLSIIPSLIHVARRTWIGGKLIPLMSIALAVLLLVIAGTGLSTPTIVLAAVTLLTLAGSLSLRLTP